MKKSKFDEIIAENIMDAKKASKLVYKISEENTYDNYYNKEAFDSFVQDMKNNYPMAFKAYGEGKGSELEARDGKYPPKMASVASSSRFCYLALRNGAEAFGASGEVCFEYACGIDGIRGTAPQMDAYIPSSNTYIEVKCHEIFDAHKIVMRKQYWEKLFGKENDFNFPEKQWGEREGDKEKEFEIPLSVFGLSKKSSMFDVKQFLCHLLGVASQNRGREACLTYLFFKPMTNKKTDQANIDEVFAELKKEIKTIFTSLPIKNFIEKNNIKLSAVCEYSQVMEPLTKENKKDLLA